MVATLVLEASVERRASSSLAPGTIHKHSKLDAGSVKVDGGLIATSQLEIESVFVWFPVTTFLKVAYGTRENPGGSGTSSEATPQTTERREHYAAKSFSVRTGQQLQLGGDRGKAWPKQVKSTHRLVA